MGSKPAQVLTSAQHLFKDNTTAGLTLKMFPLHTGQRSSRNGDLRNSVNSISEELSRAGAYDNRFGHTIAVQELTAKATKIARGRIMDADIAEESTRLSKAQVLAQANTAMLAQANKSMSRVLALFN